MKKLIIAIFALITITTNSFSQNPYEQFGCEGRLLQTEQEISGANYYEITSKDSLYKLYVDFDSKQVIAKDSSDKIISIGKLVPVVVMKWQSRDPLESKFPDESPYIFCGNNPIIYIDPEGKEKLVVVGNQGDSPNSDKNDDDDGYTYMEGTRHFLQAGLDQARTYKKEAGDEQVTLIIYTGNYSLNELFLYYERAEDDGIEVMLINDDADIADYVNKKQIWSFFGHTGERDDDLISDFMYIGHGNKNKMLIGYNYFWGFTDDLSASDFSKEAFDKKANITMNSCASGLGEMYETCLKLTNGTVTGYNVTVEWGVGGIGKYRAYHLEYVALSQRDKPRKRVKPKNRIRKQKGTRSE